MWGFQNRVCLSVPEKRNHHSFVNISPTLVIDTSMERSSRVLYHQQSFFFIKNAYPSLSAVMFCKQFLAYTVHIERCYHSIHKHSCGSQHISVLTRCTFVFRQVCTIKPSFFNRRPFEGRHLAFILCYEKTIIKKRFLLKFFQYW